MLINRTAGGTDLQKFLPVLKQSSGSLASAIGFSGVPLGFDWGLAVDVGLWLGQGIRMGMRVNEALRRDEGKPAGIETLDRQDVGAMAAQLAQMNPDRSGRSAAQWEQALLGAGLGSGIDPGKTCPTGFYMDPASGACMPIKAGFWKGLPDWGKIAMIGGAAFVVIQTGMLKGLFGK